MILPQLRNGSGDAEALNRLALRWQERFFYPSASSHSSIILALKREMTAELL